MDNSPIKEFRFNQRDDITEWALTIGSFDGFHRGHQQIIQKMKAHAADSGAGVRVVSFEPHPRNVLFPETPFNRIYGPQEKIAYCKRYGVDSLLVINFTKEFAGTSADEFLSQYLPRFGKISKIFIGANFSFGKNRSGTAQTLQNYLNKENITVELLDLYKIDGERISSSKIRKLIQANEFEQAEKLLGRAWEISGEVTSGQKLGAKLGFPTANIQPNYSLPIRTGVFATVSTVKGIDYPSVTNIGTRPTVQKNSSINIETHILHFNQTIYGDKLTLKPVSYLRSEIKFDGIDALKQQIRIDIENTRKILGV